MLKNQIKSAWRQIYRNKDHSIINIFGLALALASVFLIQSWVQNELSYDRFHKNGDRIFRVVNDWSKYDWQGMATTPFPLGPVLKEQVPEVWNSARIGTENSRLFRCMDAAFYENRGITADPSFFELFSFPFLRGNPRTALNRPDGLIITESMARKYFGTDDPMGEEILIDGQPATVLGVVRNIPARSSLQFDYVRPIPPSKNNHWGAFNFTTFLQLSENADPDSIGAKITAISRSQQCPQIVNGATQRLQALSGIHLDGNTVGGSTTNTGDSKYVLLFSVVAVFVLVISCINFINISLAGAELRSKEFGLHKVVGAGRKELMQRFLIESLLKVLTASALAIALVFILNPLLTSLVDQVFSAFSLELNHLTGFAAIVFFVVLLTGTYPALILSSCRPVEALNASGHPTGKRNILRQSLVVFQFSLSIILIISSLVVYRQFRTMRTAKLGYTTDNVILLPARSDAGKSYEILKNQLQSNPAILGVTAQGYEFAKMSYHSKGNWDWEGRKPDHQIDMVVRGVEFEFFETLNIPLKYGRFFSKEIERDTDEAVILNEEAVSAMGITDPVGKWFSYSADKRRRIVGVIRSPHFLSFHHQLEPEVFFIDKIAESSGSSLIMVRIRSDRIDETLSFIRDTWKQNVPGAPFEFHFLDDTYASLYRMEERMSKVFSLFATLAVFIASLGLLGLTLFLAGRRQKEIGIRKTVGATSSGIILLFLKQTTRWVLLASVIAWPAAYWTMSRILQAYVFRIPLSWPVFFFSSLGAFLLASLIVVSQTMRFASIAPGEALRTE